MFHPPYRSGLRAALGLLMLAAALTAHAQATAPAAPASAAPAAAPEASPSGDNRQGTFKTVQGEVTVVRGDVRSAAILGGPVHASDRIVTGPASAAAIGLRDGTVLAIGADSLVDLAQFQFDSTTEQGNVLVRLARGTLRMITGLVARTQPEQVKVSTPTAVIGVRGTDFIVETP